MQENVFGDSRLFSAVLLSLKNLYIVSIVYACVCVCFSSIVEFLFHSTRSVVSRNRDWGKSRMDCGHSSGPC